MEVSHIASISTAINSSPRSLKTLNPHPSKLNPPLVRRQQCTSSSRPVCRNVSSQKCGVVPRQVNRLNLPMLRANLSSFCSPTPPGAEAAVPERANEVLRRGRPRAVQQRAQAALLQQPRGEVRVRPQAELQVRAEATVPQGIFQKLL